MLVVLEKFLEDDDKLLLLLLDDHTPVGFLAALISVPLISRTRIATEAAWFVQKDHRGRSSLKLLEGFEYWARKVVKADFIQVANLANLDLSGFYTKRGYTKLETAYMKAI